MGHDLVGLDDPHGTDTGGVQPINITGGNPA
jgi:3,4-dihydroxy 2-butanone 4-phosphate synthase/GTP cyclohydrolase II